MVETQPIAPASLLVDEENPRLAEPNEGQREAIRAMAHKEARKLVVLAKDILQYGLNPSEMLLVMPVDDELTRYRVLEGNRRLAALKALENPELLAETVSPSVLNQFRRLARQYQDNPVETVQCSVVKSRDEARHWIQLKHTGENEGAGVSRWGSDESARFRARTGPTEPHTQALDFLERGGHLTPQSRGRVPTTNFKRLLGTPEVRDKIGLELQDGVLQRVASERNVAKALLHIIRDLESGKTRVTDIYTKPARVEYARKLPSSVAVKATMAGRGVPLDTSTAAPRPKGGKQAVARRPRKRDRLIPRECILSVTDSRTRDIEGELRKLSLEDHTNAVSVTFRVFLELSVDSYIEAGQFAGVNQNLSLSKKLTVVANDLVKRQKLTDQQAKPVRRAAQKDSFLAPSVEQMNQYVHNKHVFPAPSDLRAYWDSLQAFVKAIWTA